mmetsp:Transcript_85971/g.239246  ORF Transcript_85971/g.239246 Transcript_85971/m.239246 type:complete len:184 (-) Transcript_85971:145-696(-)
MFQCRLCSENPFQSLFAPVARSQPKDREGGRRKSSKQRAKKAGSRRDEVPFEPWPEEEIQKRILLWEQYVHPRARDFFSGQEELHATMRQVLSGISRHDDPVLGPEDRDVYWYGDVTQDDLQAALRMVRPGDASETVTYVNRVLAFLFATDDSFEQLKALPKEPFTMRCGDQLCVHLAHISLE